MREELEQLRSDKDKDQEENSRLQVENEELKQSNKDMNSRLDKFLQMTQQDRVQSTVSKMDLNNYIEQIARLKKSEQQLRLKIKQQQIAQNSQQKQNGEVNVKYVAEMETNKELRSKVE